MMKVVALSGFDHGGLVRRGQVMTVSAPTGEALIQRGLARPERTELLSQAGAAPFQGGAQVPVKPISKTKRAAP